MVTFIPPLVNARAAHSPDIPAPIIATDRIEVAFDGFISFMWEEGFTLLGKIQRFRVAGQFCVTNTTNWLPMCRSTMKIISFVEDPAVVRKILKHLGIWETEARHPPRKINSPCTVEPIPEECLP